MGYWQAASMKPEFELLAEASSPYERITATLDWCEENLFAPIWFIAEFFNTISNAAMLLLGLYGAYRTYRQGLAWRFILGYLGLALVGVGSTLFHATLLFEFQLADELPMLWADAVFLYCIAPKRWREQNESKFILLGGLALYTFGTTGIYVYTRNAIFFECAYGLGAVILLVHCLHWSWTKGTQPRFAPIRRIITIGAASFLSAFLVWNLDNVFCDQLRAARAWLNSPLLAPLLQFHAWWHLGTAYGTYLLGVFLSYRNQVEEDEEMFGNRNGSKGRFTHGTTWFGLPILVEQQQGQHDKPH